MSLLERRLQEEDPWLLLDEEACRRGTYETQESRAEGEAVGAGACAVQAHGQGR